MYERPLLTLDGSELATAATPHAARLAGPGGSVIVLEVIGPRDHVDYAEAPDGSKRTPEEVVAAMEQEAHEHLDAAAEVLKSLGVAEVTPVIGVGPAGIEIIRVAEERECDVIAMASRGRGGIRRAVIGSVTDYVARHSMGTPVLVVPVGESAASRDG